MDKDKDMVLNTDEVSCIYYENDCYSYVVVLNNGTKIKISDELSDDIMERILSI